jgi:putative glutamine amidotransferase
MPSQLELVIGIVSAFDADKRSYACKPAYIEAISAAGALPLIVPYLRASEDIERVVEMTDGIVVIDGEDAIDPALFGQRPHPKVTWINHERDRFELALVRSAIELDRPVLGICRGMQLINVALGGSLCQHLMDERRSELDHMAGTPLTEMAHDLELCGGTILSRLVGADARRRVNSAHFQGIEVLAPSARVSATAPDGTIEAIEVDGLRFVVGVQWHPEELVDCDALSGGLFHEFVSACRLAPVARTV